MTFDLKNILLGIIIGIISTISILSLMGNINIEADFQFGEKSDKSNEEINIE